MKLFSSDFMMEMMDGNVSEVIAIAEMFLDLGPKMLEDIGEAIDKEDWLRAGKAAHKLKSSLMLWRINSLVELAVSIENNGYQKSNTEDIKSDFIELKKGLNIALGQMKEEFSL
ncbi:MAG: hypothetical protein B6I18_02935 [Bacteroidetes bacterium 4572_112]|nr:MAG: hypothetical protein B6I18_02935 [Bacteroidetes bacterium 4572_112]